MRRHLPHSLRHQIVCHDFYLIRANHIIRTRERNCLNQLVKLIDGFGQKSQTMSLVEMKQSLKPNDLLLLPRRGTRSPWASKAGSILSSILPKLDCRIEKGLLINQLEAGSHIIDKLEAAPCYDQMTEEPFSSNTLTNYFNDEPIQKNRVNSIKLDQLEEFNRLWGLALSKEELEHLMDFYHNTKSQPTDLELMAFAQLNSEHCRHKIFNSRLYFNDKTKAPSLFSLIKSTAKLSPLISAYKDNAAIFATQTIHSFNPAPTSFGKYSHKKQKVHLVFKAETHNHPTFVSPYPGAATGVGGEIRDELACGRGAHSKAGFVGFNVSELSIERGLRWERNLSTPVGKATGLSIMTQAPLGGSNYGNEYGRPTLAGYFRTLCCVKDGIEFGYHKPLMLAGGWGEINANQLDKKIIDPAALLIVLGEPALRIGIGGSSTSSRASQDVQLDFASVQRDNAEMERRCAEVIRQCVLLGDENPIQFIHDLGAGGIGNAIAELLKDNNCGGEIRLDKIPIDDKTMTAREIWNNESQERFIIATSKLELFARICRRENAPFAVIGKVNPSKRLHILSEEEDTIMDVPLKLLFPNQKLVRSGSQTLPSKQDQAPPQLKPEELLKHSEEVLRLPAVASKSFLITIGDRSVGGLTAREQLVGPWQQPVSDYAATMADYEGYGGEVCALGERSPVAVINPPAAARLALGEVITNLAASGIKKMKDIRLCANWMAAVDSNDQLYQLYQSVLTITQELCPQLQLSIPVGKDSLFMKAEWDHKDKRHRVISPISLVMSGLAQAKDLRYGLSPQLEPIGQLWLVSLGSDPSRLGGSALYQTINYWQGETADLDDPQKLKDFFAFISGLVHKQILSAYHDCSDGGIWAALCEMAFCANCGIKAELSQLMKKEKDIYRALFNEELGALVQVKPDNQQLFHRLANQYQLSLYPIGTPVSANKISICLEKEILLETKMTELRSIWHSLSDSIRHQRDNPICIKQETAIQSIKEEKGLQEKLSFDLQQKYQSIAIYSQSKPRVAILRTQGINGQREMAAAFTRAGFSTDDIHINDLLDERNKGLRGYKGLVFCGGFSYGDALGAGSGWAAEILLNSYLRQQFETFFHRQDTFTLGVCNGCQTLAKMAAIIPGANWQCDFLPNQSARFEARTIMVTIPDSPSIFFRDMATSLLPVSSAHAEGRASFSSEAQAAKIVSSDQVAMFYADAQGKATQNYPFNPNGSANAIAALTSEDGRVTIMMPHPERVLRRLAQNWRKPTINKMKKAGDDYSSDSSPWFALFLNARLWVS